MLRHPLINKGQLAGLLYAPVQRHAIWVQPLSRVWLLIVLCIVLAMTSQGGASEQTSKQTMSDFECVLESQAQNTVGSSAENAGERRIWHLRFHTSKV